MLRGDRAGRRAQARRPPPYLCLPPHSSGRTAPGHEHVSFMSAVMYGPGQPFPRLCRHDASASQDLPEEVKPHMETHGIVMLITTILTLIAYRVW